MGKCTYYLCIIFARLFHTCWQDFAQKKQIVWNLIYTWRRWALHENQGHPTQNAYFWNQTYNICSERENVFLSRKLLILVQEASSWSFRWKRGKSFGDTRIPVKLPFAQAFLKLCSQQLLRRLCQLGYLVLFILLSECNQHNVQLPIAFICLLHPLSSPFCVSSFF